MGQRLRIPKVSRLILIIAALAVLLPTPLTLAQGTAVFSRIDVAGNQRIEADSIRAFAGIEPGQAVSPEIWAMPIGPCRLSAPIAPVTMKRMPFSDWPTTATIRLAP